VLALLGLGLVLQASHASTILAPADFAVELRRELLLRVLALGVLLGAMRLGPSRVRHLIPLGVAGSLLLLILIWVPGLGVSVNGARRWLDLGVSVQPSDLARIAVVLWVADRCVRLGPKVREWRAGVLPMLMVVAVFVVTIVIQPDLGGSLLLLVCALATMWVGGVGLGTVGMPLVLAGTLGVAAGGTFLPYVRRRLGMWLGGVENEQVSDSVDALANAGWVGEGLTHGELRNAGFKYMDSDFVYALVGEELGLLGLLAVLGLLLAFLWYALRMVLALRDRFDAVAVFGLCIGIAFQALVHIQVSAGMAPPKGMTLPFLSAGGTSLLVSCLAAGLALGAVRSQTPHAASGTE
ncbi:MAG TPA: FtsW/RodA/SpoVE family cell cycle protein, partial [Planctomycetota bacterium]|nr:FtsW/RodA/SpoVE family cell cycle protein [Planctomycetota bacterium]